MPSSCAAPDSDLVVFNAKRCGDGGSKVGFWAFDEDRARPAWPAWSALFSEPMPTKILIAKPGLDGHDRGAKVVVRALRDAGYDVVYSGLHQTPEQIAERAAEEDVAAVGLSSLSGAHMTLFPKVAELLREQGTDVVVFGGGIIPEEDEAALIDAGIAVVFTPGTPLHEITAWVDGVFEGE